MEARTVVGILPRVYNEDDPNTTKQLCVYKADGYEYAYYARSYFIYPYWRNFGTFGEAGIAISIAGQDFRPVPSLDYSNGEKQTYLGKTKAYLRQYRNANWAYEFHYYRDISEHLELDTDGTYKIVGDADFVYANSAGDHLSAEGVGVSANGKWVTFDSPNVGLVEFDTGEMSTKRISDRFIKRPSTWPNPVPATSVSDDGKYVVVGGWNMSTEVVQVNEQCGAVSDVPLVGSDNRLNEKNCPYVDLTNSTWQNSQPNNSGGYTAFLDVRMNGDGGGFEYYDSYQWHVIYANNARPLSAMRFLALGDSYASGEGDLSLDGNDYYLAGTNVYGNYSNNIPREMCHLSNRSYPFLLARSMSLTPGGNMRSVACSGAVTSDVSGYDGSSLPSMFTGSYQGQMTQGMSWGENIPRLQGIIDTKELQAEALEKYIPGRLQQAKFVEKTKPEVATIMIGGNDMKFGDVLSQCIMSVKIGIGQSCKYARQEGRQELAQTIHDDYPKLVNTYSALKQASSKYTKIYVIGYPQLVSAKKFACLSTLDQAERATIVESVTYANAVIRQAALAAGVNYIDISDSLVGNELCSGGMMKYQYITYLTQLSYSKLASEVAKGKRAKDIFDKKGFYERGMQTDLNFLENYMLQRGTDSYEEFSYSPWTAIQGMAQQMVHPNAAGHEAIYKSIIKNFDDAGLDVCKPTVNLVCTEAPQSGLSAPEPSTYMAGIGIKSGVTYISGDGPITVQSRIDGALKNAGNSIKKGADTVIKLIPEPDWGKLVGTPRVTLHSDIKNMGVMSADGMAFTLNATVPRDIPVGVHTIYISSQVQGGKQVVITKDVFIEGPQGDVDEDGIQDGQDSCAFGRPNGSDADGDGIADDCGLGVESSQSDGAHEVRRQHEQGGASTVSVRPEPEIAVAAESPLREGRTFDSERPLVTASNNETSGLDSRDKWQDHYAMLLNIGAVVVVAVVALLLLKKII